MKISNVNKKRLATLLLAGFLLLPAGCHTQPQKVESTPPVLTVVPNLEPQMEIEVPKEFTDMGYIAMPQTELEMKEIMLNNSSVFRYKTSQEKIYVELIANFYHGITVDENNKIIDTIYSGNLSDLKEYDYYKTVTKIINVNEVTGEIVDKPEMQEQTISLYTQDGNSKKEMTVTIPLEFCTAKSVKEQFKEMPQTEEEMMAIVEEDKKNASTYYVIETVPLFTDNNEGLMEQIGTRKIRVKYFYNILYLESYLEEGIYEFEETKTVYRGYTKTGDENSYSYTGMTENFLDLKNCDFYTVSIIQVPMIDIEKRIEEAKENFFPKVPDTQEEIDAIMAESYYTKEVDGVVYEHITYYRGIKFVEGKKGISSWTTNLNDLKDYDYYQVQSSTRVMHKEVEQSKII